MVAKFASEPPLNCGEVIDKHVDTQYIIDLTISKNAHPSAVRRATRASNLKVYYRAAIQEEKEVKTVNKRKGERRENPHTHEPEEREGMPHHQHCPLEKRRGDRNPKYHED
jgi:hypothetical protein